MGFKPSAERVIVVMRQRLIVLGVCCNWRFAGLSVIVNKKSQPNPSSQLVLRLMGWREIVE